MDYYANTDIGKLRSKNQDQAAVYANSKNQVLSLVCDGMGGHKSGEVASRVVADYVYGCFKGHPGFEDKAEAKEWLENTILDSHQLVRKMSTTSHEHEGMGTTIVATIMIDGEVIICHVGDSRGYICNKEEIIQITKDHTLVNALLDKGAIQEEEIESHRQKNVLLQALGATEKIKITMSEHCVEKGILLLCSDGLYNMVKKEELLEICTQEISASNIVNELIKVANRNGGRDNIAISVVKMKGDSK